MHAILGLLRRQFLGAIALAVALAGVASGAAPKYLQLGARNDAPRTTVLRNNGTGPALTFGTRLTAPPFRVESRKVVPRLNAALLQGRNAKSFAATGSSYTKSESDARYPTKTASYTRTESDERYLRQEASVGFMSGNSFTLLPPKLVSGNDGYVINNTAPFLPEQDIVAPGNGRIMVTAFGSCTVGNAADTGVLAVRVGGPEGEVSSTFSSIQGAFCRVSSTRTVAAGEEVAVIATVTDLGASGALFKGTVVVEFLAS